MTSPVLLGSYPAKQCAHRTYLKLKPNPPAPAEHDATTRGRMEAGNAFEVRVLARLADVLGGDLTTIADEAGNSGSGNKQRRIDETLVAMRHGAFMIAGGQLPDDESGGRTGSPDLLLCAGMRGGTYRYFPVDVKHHRAVKLGKPGRRAPVVSLLSDPLDMHELAEATDRVKHRRDDALQLAHYTRMLESLGLHPGERWLRGAIIGDPSDGELLLTWHDLSEEFESAWSAQGKVDCSVLQIYDTEFALRHRIAEAAAQGKELVRAYGKGECATCPFRQHCAETAPASDPSFAITAGRLTDREWDYLYEAGAGTIEGLAAIETEGELLEGFLAAAADQKDPNARLAKAIRRAAMHRDGVALERTTEGPLEVPSADVEIDFDIEWDADERVYLWGLWISEGDRPSEYRSFHSFEELDESSTQHLADSFFEWLRAYVHEIESSGRSVMIYHWTHPETTRSIRAWPGAAEFFEGRICDLNKVVASNFFARDGFGVKEIAPAFGFSWTAENAGGAESMRMIEQVRIGHEESGAWLLEYNRDDVRATAAVRDGMRALGDARVVRA